MLPLLEELFPTLKKVKNHEQQFYRIVLDLLIFRHSYLPMIECVVSAPIYYSQ
jgi:hypothetical protein